MAGSQASDAVPPAGAAPAAGVDRRQIIGGAVVLSALVGLPLYAWQQARDGMDGGASESEKLLIARLSDLVIPATDTPGAVAVGVPTFVELALLHGLDETAPPVSGPVRMANYRGGFPVLEQVARDLDRKVSGSFLHIMADRQHDVLADYDAEAFGGERQDHPWKKIKALILTGYYTSEVGASRELQYELVPGRWEPDLPLPPNNRSWSSDWTAVDFG
ncbi:gluconate 2-dehydrogenase subunit 3 family protein [Sphingobium sp.]|uniref:gluconate 2-dehydrogenase subunit 3 family protein n=1 Tax=Sphingobium sp. TaxID=1912891 RepID=UPI00261AFFE7|nr:gluconate 2-dehydrogenase subunit 3 family protein [Sphingobium sp.]